MPTFHCPATAFSRQELKGFRRDILLDFDFDTWHGKARQTASDRPALPRGAFSSELAQRLAELRLIE